MTKIQNFSIIRDWNLGIICNLLFGAWNFMSPWASLISVTTCDYFKYL